MKFSCPVVLASASPRRKELLAGMGVEFTAVTADVEEISPDSGLSASETARANAGLKAKAVAALYPDALVIGSDTVVACAGRIFGKPDSEADAGSMLRTLSGREHEVMSGVALIRGKEGLERSFVEISHVSFKVLSDAVIREYMRLVNVMDKAGAYAIQEHSELILSGLTGSLSNVIGLPVERLRRELMLTGLVLPERPEK